MQHQGIEYNWWKVLPVLLAASTLLTCCRTAKLQTLKSADIYVLVNARWRHSGTGAGNSYLYAERGPWWTTGIAIPQQLHKSHGTTSSSTVSSPRIYVPGFSWNCTKCYSQVGPIFHWFGEEAPNVGDDTGFLQSCNPLNWNAAHITICLAENLHILGGDKNGSHHICLGWNLQNQTKYLIPSIKFFLLVMFMGLSAVIYCALYLSGLFV
jgi:hypothetical protein